MSRRRIIISLLTLLTGALLVYFYFFASKNKTYQWFESYDSKSDQPYGTLFIRKLLESYRPGGTFILNQKKSIHQILDSTSYPVDTDYILIGASAYLDRHDVDALANFIHQGNDAFIASHEIQEELINTIYDDPCEYPIGYLTNYSPEVTLNFYHDSLRTQTGYTYKYRVSSMDLQYDWNYLTQEALCDSSQSIVPLGHQEGSAVNFFKIPYGKGNLYLHSNPLVFTNYFLVHPDKAEYAATIFSHLRGKNIIWDDFSKLPFSQNHNEYNSPLYFVLQQPSLKYAWWMILITILFFVIFAAKRKQKVIPVLEPKTNTSLEFVTMISALHYQNGNHLDIAQKKMKYFLYFIRTKYGIHTSTFTQTQVPVLAARSKVKETHVQHLFERWVVIEKFGFSGIEDHRLVDLYYAMDTFYKNCR